MQGYLRTPSVYLAVAYCYSYLLCKVYIDALSSWLMLALHSCAAELLVRIDVVASACLLTCLCSR